MILGIYGAGGLGREILDIALRINQVKNKWEEICFIDDISTVKQLNGMNVINFEELKNLKNAEVIIAIGEPLYREQIYIKLINNNIKLSTLIDPTAIISKHALIEEGVIIGAYSSINTNAQIKTNCLIQPYCLIGHDVKIGKHSVISTHFTPGGGCEIGDRVFVGMKSTVKEKIEIGNDCIIGMGSVVFKNTTTNMIVMGNPARAILKNEEHKVFKK